MAENNSFPKVSIIMPTWNRAALILATIRTVQDQTYSHWELIIVDDGSDDQTEEIVEGLKDQQIQFYKAGRIGIGGKIKNIGLDQARGDLIAFIDSDDLWEPTKLEKQVAALRQYPAAGFCLTNGYTFKKLGEPDHFFYSEKEGVKYGPIFLDLFRSKIAAYTQVLLFRKECLPVAGLFKEVKSFSDLDFIISLAAHFNAAIVYEPLLFRRLHDSNYIHSNWEKSCREGIELIKQYQEQIPPAIVKDALFRTYINFGEKYLQYHKRKKAIGSFLKSWRFKPLSIVPLKKTVKAIIR